MYDYDNIIRYVLIGFVVLFIIFLILRELNCWYWKINRMADTLDRIDNSLEQLSKKVDALGNMLTNQEKNNG